MLKTPKFVLVHSASHVWRHIHLSLKEILIFMLKERGNCLIRRQIKEDFNVVVCGQIFDWLFPYFINTTRRPLCSSLCNKCVYTHCSKCFVCQTLGYIYIYPTDPVFWTWIIFVRWSCIVNKILAYITKVFYLFACLGFVPLLSVGCEDPIFP